MTIYTIVVSEGNSKRAVAAFISKEQAEAYMEEKELAGKARVDFFEVPADFASHLKKLFAAHRQVRESAFELAGYYFTHFEAERVLGGNPGEITELPIDNGEEEKEPEEKPAEAPAIFPQPSPAKPKPKRKPSSGKPKPARARLPAKKTPAAGRGSRSAKADEHLPPTHLLYILGALIVAVVWLNIAVFRGLSSFEFEEHLPGADWLPREAEDVCYFKSGEFFVFECSLPEEAFRKWAGEEELPVAEIGEKPAKITRYLFYSPEPLPGVEEMRTQEQMDKWEALTTAAIYEGYYFSGEKDGEKIAAGYDRRMSRMYCHRAEL